MKNPSWMYRQSGTVPYRIKDENIWILLITNRKGSKWGIPKGIVDRTMKASDSALKETFEEAGVRGKIIKPALGVYKVKKWEGKCRIKVFMLPADEVFDEWPEKIYRKRIWVRIEEAEKYIKKKKLLKLINKIPSFIEKYAECF